MRSFIIALFICIVLGIEYNIDASKKTADVPKTLYGAFFEEISHAGDGGLYPEKIFNKNFAKDFQTFGWSIKALDDTYATMKADNEYPLNGKNPYSLKVEVSKAGTFPLYVDNEGYTNSVWNNKYDVSMYYRFISQSKDNKLTVRVFIHSGVGNGPHSNLEPAVFTLDTQEETETAYKYIESILDVKSEHHCPYIRFEIVPSINEPFTLFIAFPSIMPQTNIKKIGDTFKMREDLYDFVGGIKHGMLRFPGGNFEAGDTFDQATYWKNDIGAVEERKGHLVPWLPPYYYTAGIGEYEFLLWAEDQKMEPEWVLNCGITLNGDVLPDDQLQVVLQDFLDAIEFANGSTNTTWGALRAKYGHPESFNLKYVAVGNEHCLGDKRHANYRKVYPIFYKAIKAQYPDILVVANCDDNQLGSYDAWDEHIYDVNIGNDYYYHKYDNYDRKAAKILITEYSATTWYQPKNDDMENLITAIKEASYLVGVQRNADVMVMASWAPLFYDDRVIPGIGGWPHGLIHFDDRTVYGTPSYYMVKMMAEVRGDYNLYHEEKLQNERDYLRYTTEYDESKKGIHGNSVGLRTLASYDAETKKIAFRVVNLDEVEATITINIQNITGTINKVSITTLSGPHKYMMNSVVYPTLIAPVTSQSDIKDNSITYTVPALSFTVFNFDPAN